MHALMAAILLRMARLDALLKKPFKHDESVVFSGRREGFTGEEITAGVIGDGQRVAILTIAQRELTLVIGAP